MSLMPTNRLQSAGTPPPPSNLLPSTREEEKTKEVGKTALSLLGSQLLTHFDSMGVDPTFGADIEKIMNLQKVEGSYRVQKANKEIHFTPKEMTLINQLFTRWSLIQELCLLELWAFDTAYFLGEIAKYLPETKKDELINGFHANFFIGYISFVVASNPARSEKIKFKERGVVHSELCFVMSKQEWIYRLQDLNNDLKIALGNKRQIKTIKQKFQEVEARLQLGQRLLADPEATYLLTENNLVHLGENILPQASRFEKGDPHKTLADLILYTNFLAKAQQAAHNQQLLTIYDNFFSILHQYLCAFSLQKNKLKGIKELKKGIVGHFLNVSKGVKTMQAMCVEAQEGHFTHQQYCEYLAIPAAKKKTQNEFISMLTVGVSSYGLINLFSRDLIVCLEDQVMEILYPENFISVRASIQRLFFILVLFQANPITQRRDLHQNLPNVIVSSEQKNAFNEVTSKMHQRLDYLMFCLLTEIKPFLAKVRTVLKHVKETQALIDYTLWLPLVAGLNQEAFHKTIDQLEPIRKGFLAQAESFLKTLDPQELIKHRIEWETALKQIAFHSCLDLCRLALIFQDAKFILQFEVDLSSDLLEDDLLPSSLVDFMEMEEIEAILDRLTQPPEPLPVIATQPIQPIKIENVNRPATAPPIPTENKEKEEIFKIRRGEKTRKVLDRLRKLGIIPTKTKRGGTSHQKLETEEGKTSTVLSIAGKRQHIPRGTAQAIAKQIAQSLGKTVE